MFGFRRNLPASARTAYAFKVYVEVSGFGLGIGCNVSYGICLGFRIWDESDVATRLPLQTLPSSMANAK